MKKKVLFLNELGYRFKYPHHFDLALAFSAENLSIECAIISVDDEIVFAAASRASVDVFRRDNNLFSYVITMIKVVKKFDLIVASTPISLLAFFFKKPGARFIYMPFELFELVKGKFFQKAFLQYLLKVLPIPIYQTSKLRAKVFRKIYKPCVIVKNYPLAPAKPTKESLSINTKFEKFITEQRNRYPGTRIVVYLGGMSVEYGISLIEETEHRDINNIIFLFIGSPSGEFRDRLLSLVESRENVIFFGSLDCDRSELISNLKLCDAGLVWKSYIGQDMNDRTYTPNKIYDFFGAGLPVVVNNRYNGDLKHMDSVWKIDSVEEFDSLLENDSFWESKSLPIYINNFANYLYWRYLF